MVKASKRNQKTVQPFSIIVTFGFYLSLACALICCVDGLQAASLSRLVGQTHFGIRRQDYAHTSTLTHGHASLGLGPWSEIRNKCRNSLQSSFPVSLSESECVNGTPVDISHFPGALFTKLQNKVNDACQRVPSLCSASLKEVCSVVKQSWWCLPMFLALIPIYSAVVHQTSTATPSWWKLENIDSIFNSPYANLLVAAFLLSNIAYFISGIYLLNKFPRIGEVEEEENSKSVSYPALGSIILTAGGVSTIFHAVQSLGSYAIAESLCYIDHAVAISSCFYFYRKCGAPSGKTLAVGLSGVTMLFITGPGYAFLHSAWHFFSAAAAVFWARDGLERRNSLHNVAPQAAN